MHENEKKALSNVRFEHANECLTAAQSLLDSSNYKSAANRSYYAIFHAMRAVLAFDGIDMKHHSGIISEFRRLYIKTGIFDAKLSQIISILFDIRTESDYDDFFIISKQEVEEQIENAKYFLKEIERFLLTK
ncbi:MAG: HEPN domain-containing protein [Ruminococcaceae bacterium]|nr:HEPN domain-containing protein [Oscillospiraceae bacterium]